MINSIFLVETAQGGNAGVMQIVMLVALAAVFYFLMIRPQSKRNKEIRKFREGLKSGDKIITAGGIHGKIKEIAENYILIEIADGVRIKIDKGSVYPSAAEAAQQGK